MRILALYILIFGLAIYAWKDWFKSLCGLIVLMAVIELEDMPKSMFGIQGFNVWNILFVVIFLAWLAARSREGLRWDLPRYMGVLLLLYLGVIIVGVLRAIFDRGYFAEYPIKSLVNEELINTIKWVLPGLLLYDGCRTRNRVVMALACLLILYFVVAVLVARCMPPSAVFSDSGVIDRARYKLNERVGYSAPDVSAMLGGACWGLLAALPLIRKKSFKIAALAAVAMIVYSQALTGGRAGYAAWAATGLLMCLIRWRRYLLLAPVIVLVLPIIFPGAAARMLEGFGQTNVAGETYADEETITAGRTTAWPYVIDKIYQSPFIGYGRLAMRRTGLYDIIEADHPGTGAPHPHNMYLETLLDNGLIGSFPIWLFWFIVVIYSAKLFLSKNRLCSAIGGLSLGLTLCSLLAGIGGQHFYPQEHTFGIWMALFLSLRVHIEQKEIQRTIAVNEISSLSL